MPWHLSLDLSGIPLRLRLNDARVAAIFEADWREYVSAEAEEPLLDLLVECGGPAAPEGPLQTHDMRAELRGRAARFSSVEGAIDLQPSGLALALLAPAPPERQFWTLVNLICAGLAWLLPRRGGLLLHAAAVVLDERAFLLVGPAGSGKSTWAELARGAGARFLTDDLALVDVSGPQVHVLATPIRADDPRPEPPARWPVAALLLPDHGPAPKLEPLAPLAAAARVAANLPFVAEWLEREPRIGAAVHALTSRVALYRLTFAPEPSFVACLRALS